MILKMIFPVLYNSLIGWIAMMESLIALLTRSGSKIIKLLNRDIASSLVAHNVKYIFWINHLKYHHHIFKMDEQTRNKYLQFLLRLVV